MSSRCARLSRLFGVCKSFQLTCQFALRVTLALTGKDPIATDSEMTKIRICKRQIVLSLMTSGLHCDVETG